MGTEEKAPEQWPSIEQRLKIEASTFTTSERFAEFTARVLSQATPDKLAGRDLNEQDKKTIQDGKDLTREIAETLMKHAGDYQTGKMIAVVTNLLTIYMEAALEQEHRRYFLVILDFSQRMLSMLAQAHGLEEIFGMILGEHEFKPPKDKHN